MILVQQLLERGDVALVQQEVPVSRAWHLTYDEDAGYEVWRFNSAGQIEPLRMGVNFNYALEYFKQKIMESKK